MRLSASPRREFALIVVSNNYLPRQAASRLGVGALSRVVTCCDLTDVTLMSLLYVSDKHAPPANFSYLSPTPL